MEEQRELGMQRKQARYETSASEGKRKGRKKGKRARASDAQTEQPVSGEASVASTFSRDRSVTPSGRADDEDGLLSSTSTATRRKLPASTPGNTAFLVRQLGLGGIGRSGGLQGSPLPEPDAVAQSVEEGSTIADVPPPKTKPLALRPKIKKAGITDHDAAIAKLIGATVGKHKDTAQLDSETGAGSGFEDTGVLGLSRQDVLDVLNVSHGHLC